MIFRFLTFITFFALLAAASPAEAQTAQLSSTVAPRGGFSLGPGQEETFTWTVSAVNAGAAAVTVTPALVVPSGWTAQADLSAFTLGGPGGQTSRPIEIRIAIPPDATEVASGQMKLQATGTTAAGDASPTEQTVFLTYVAPIIPPAPVPPDYTWVWASAIGSVVLLAGFAVYLVQARRIGVRVDNPVRRFNIGTGGAYKVIVENPRGVPQNVQLRVTRLPRDWSAAFSFPVVPLNGGERSEVPLWVNVPVDALPNESRAFRIQARPNRFSPWLVSRKLEIKTLDVDLDRKPA